MAQTVSGKEVTTKALDEFCRDLCEQARKKGVDPVRFRNASLFKPYSLQTILVTNGASAH